MTFEKIDIDLDVHKTIEANRKDFRESANSILRRLLGVEPAADFDRSTERRGGSNGRPWRGKGKSRDLILPHGTELILRYNDQQFDGRIDDGRYLIDGLEFDSPSAAALSLCRTKTGRKTRLNGKVITSARLPGSTQHKLLTTIESELRRGSRLSVIK